MELFQFICYPHSFINYYKGLIVTYLIYFTAFLSHFPPCRRATSVVSLFQTLLCKGLNIAPLLSLAHYLGRK